MSILTKHHETETEGGGGGTGTMAILELMNKKKKKKAFLFHLKECGNALAYTTIHVARIYIHEQRLHWCHHNALLSLSLFFSFSSSIFQ